MQDRHHETLAQLCADARETALLESIESLLGWDERTYLPPAAGAYRAEQITYLSGWIHRRRTAPQIGEWLDELRESPLAADLHSDTGATIRELDREYRRLVKLPSSFVEELTRATVLGQQCWTEARQKNDFAGFQPFLERIFSLKREQAEMWGYPSEPYDALLDDFEPGAETATVAQTLDGLRSGLAPLVAEIAECNRQAPCDLLTRHYPRAAQQAFGDEAAAAIGFDFSRGRLDITHHPFCSSLGPDDCRITTRYDEQHFSSAFFGTLHEAGHGMYDQGLRTEQFGLPPGTYISLGIHESQSRLWENLVGRSAEFWQHFFPIAQQHFPAALAGERWESFWFAVNAVRPSLIRVEADEATYNLHIIIRFQLERAVLSGELAVADLPQAWNDRYRQYLGIEPPSDVDGVLQDIHWSAGLVGYFPTYSLGNVYAAQFFRQAEKELGDLPDQLKRGDFAPLKQWLNRNIHQRGRCYRAVELVQQVTGQPLSAEPMIEGLRNKLLPLYGLA